MMDYTRVEDMAVELENLAIFVSYGKEKLANFMAMLAKLENDIAFLSHRNQYVFYAKSCTNLMNLIETTLQSLLDWKLKISNYLSVIIQSDKMSYPSIKKIEQKISKLITMINYQIQRTSQLCERLLQVQSILNTKKQQLQPKFERAQPPSLIREYVGYKVEELMLELG